MTYTYNAKINYYSFLAGRPHAWELIFAKDAGVVQGDTINVVEVDDLGEPTGNSMTGTVKYITTEVVFAFKADSTLLYIIPD